MDLGANLVSPCDARYPQHELRRHPQTTRRLHVVVAKVLQLGGGVPYRLAQSANGSNSQVWAIVTVGRVRAVQCGRGMLCGAGKHHSVTAKPLESEVEMSGDVCVVGSVGLSLDSDPCLS